MTKAFKRKKQIRVLKIGANDGVSDDPIASMLLSDCRYGGVLVEPLPQYAAKLESVYGKTGRYNVVRAVITDVNEQIQFYFFDETKTDGKKCPLWYRGLASLDENHIKKHMPAEFHAAITSVKLDAISVPTLLEQNGIDVIDLLHIDAEGHDLRILRQFDLSHMKVSVVIVEHKHLSVSDKTSMKRILSRFGYKVREFDSDFLATLSTRFA